MAGHVISQFLEEDGKNFKVYTLARKETKIKLSYIVDVVDLDRLSEILLSGNFDFVINCAGVLNSNAEDNPSVAKFVNTDLPHFLSNVTKKLKTKIIHLSTDCVFSGKEGNYSEDHIKNGVGNYAISKSNGELSNNKDLTIRTSIIGPDLSVSGIGLFNWFVNQSNFIYGYNAAFWSGITTIELARTIRILILDKPNISGIMHLTNNCKISKYYLLSLMKIEFNLKDLIIYETSNYFVDKSLISTRKDIEDIIVNSYVDMIKEMREWILSHKYFYSHYDSKLF